jgi:hypothetical protein
MEVPYEKPDPASFAFGARINGEWLCECFDSYFTTVSNHVS